MSMRLSLVTLAALCALTAQSQATTLVVPDLEEESGLNTGLRNAPRTYMAYYNAVNFASLSGPMWITGMQLRMSALGNTALPASWPSQDLTFTNFDVKLSQASAQLDSDGEFLSSAVTFASQQLAGTVVNAHTGSLTLPTGSFQNSGGENSFGAMINFSTPYLYTPGQSLVLYISHTGYSPDAEGQAFFATVFYQNGVADAISSTAGYQAASAGGFSDPYIVQFTMTAAVPEPSTMLMLAGGIAGLLAMSRRRKAVDQA